MLRDFLKEASYRKEMQYPLKNTVALHLYKIGLKINTLCLLLTGCGTVSI